MVIETARPPSAAAPAAAAAAAARAGIGPETVCVTGASGYIGSWLVMRLLERGYMVRATLRDPGNPKKVRHLVELPGAETRLTLWKAELGVKGSFDDAIRGCDGVFHVATPMDFESSDPENEVIKPTVEGVLDIMKACVKSKTVRRLVFTSTAGAVNVEERQKPVYDESCWSDVDYIRRAKMTGWMYFASKTLAEQAAWEFAKEHELDMVTVMPTIVLGSFLIPHMPPNFLTALSLITGNEAHYSILKQGQYVHLDDLCMAHVFLYENRRAAGRYICSSHDATILQTARMLKEKYPNYDIPTKFKGVDENLGLVRFSNKKLTDLGFQFKYSFEEMFEGAIKTCQEKGLLPVATGGAK